MEVAVVTDNEVIVGWPGSGTGNMRPDDIGHVKLYNFPTHCNLTGNTVTGEKLRCGNNRYIVARVHH